MERNQRFEKGKLTSTTQVCEAWKEYQGKTWGTDSGAVTRQRNVMCDMGVDVTKKTIRKWRRGALPEKYAWVLIIKLGWPFLVAVMGKSLANSYLAMEEDYARRQEKNKVLGKALFGIMSRSPGGDTRGVHHPD